MMSLGMLLLPTFLLGLCVIPEQLDLKEVQEHLAEFPDRDCCSDWELSQAPG